MVVGPIEPIAFYVERDAPGIIQPTDDSLNARPVKIRTLDSAGRRTVAVGPVDFALSRVIGDAVWLIQARHYVLGV